MSPDLIGRTGPIKAKETKYSERSEVPFPADDRQEKEDKPKRISLARIALAVKVGLGLAGSKGHAQPCASRFTPRISVPAL